MKELQINTFISVVSWARAWVQSVQVSKVWEFIALQQFGPACEPLSCPTCEPLSSLLKGFHSLLRSNLLFVFQWAVPLVFYALPSLYLQFLRHLSETHLISQHQGIETSRCCCSSPFLEPHEEQSWSSFLCRTLTHLYPWQMPDRCQHSGFPPWGGAKLCAHSALWRVNYCFA